MPHWSIPILRHLVDGGANSRKVLIPMMTSAPIDGQPSWDGGTQQQISQLKYSAANVPRASLCEYL
jgi:hypothetical protein